MIRDLPRHIERMLDDHCPPANRGRMTLNRLAILGCDLAQGYHVSRPLPADAFSVWIGQAAEAIGGDADATAAIA